MIDDSGVRARVADALAGPGGLAGIRRCDERDTKLIIEVDEKSTPLSLVIRLIDIELATERSGRRLVAQTPLDPVTSAALARAGLADEAIDERRTIEYHLETIEGARAC